MKANTSSGPDGLSPNMVKLHANELSLPLSLLYTSFMSVGDLPQAWKAATVVPIYKKGPASDPSNYRPIALTCVLCKLMERIVAADLLAYLVKHELITKQQHGFLSKRSTSTNLIECLNDWSVNLQNREAVKVAYIDYSKAFDSVSHNKLFCKLSALGIEGSTELDQTFSDRAQPAH